MPKSEESLGEMNRVIPEETYKNLITHSLDAITISDDNGLLFANELFLELVDAANMDEVIGMSILSFVHPDFVELTKNRIQLVNQ